MRVKTLQVVWHNQKPIYSVDFHPSGVLATGGGDKDVKVCTVYDMLVTLPANAAATSVLCPAVVEGQHSMPAYVSFIATKHFTLACTHQQVILDDDRNPSVEHIGHLAGHTRDVNSVRFSPTGAAYLSICAYAL